jgi:Trk-type K+ transport system membrane component
VPEGGFVNRRPIAVTVIAWLLIAAGVLGFAVHLRELVAQKLFHFEDLWIPLVALLPAACGAFILLGHNWARWLALAWMASHVAISFFDSLGKVAVHALLLLLIAYSLFAGDAKAYFHHPDQVGT